MDSGPLVAQKSSTLLDIFRNSSSFPRGSQTDRSPASNTWLAFSWQSRHLDSLEDCLASPSVAFGLLTIVAMKGLGMGQGSPIPRRIVQRHRDLRCTGESCHCTLKFYISMFTRSCEIISQNCFSKSSCYRCVNSFLRVSVVRKEAAQPHGWSQNYYVWELSGYLFTYLFYPTMLFSHMSVPCTWFCWVRVYLFVICSLVSSLPRFKRGQRISRPLLFYSREGDPGRVAGVFMKAMCWVNVYSNILSSFRW